MENELARTQWRSSDGETARLDLCLWPVTSEDHVLILLLLWTNHLHYVFYWVSLGWFYLLDTHCDYSFISPLCGVAQTPDCGIIISAFSARGVIQTLVWHQYYYFCIYRSRSHSDTRLAPVLLFCIFPLEESFRHSFGTCIFILHSSARGVFQTLAWHPIFYLELF
jgi:hypothetical protein